MKGKPVANIVHVSSWDWLLRNLRSRDSPEWRKEFDWLVTELIWPKAVKYLKYHFGDGAYVMLKMLVSVLDERLERGLRADDDLQKWVEHICQELHYDPKDSPRGITLVGFDDEAWFEVATPFEGRQQKSWRPLEDGVFDSLDPPPPSALAKWLRDPKLRRKLLRGSKRDKFILRLYAYWFFKPKEIHEMTGLPKEVVQKALRKFRARGRRRLDSGIGERG